MMTEEELENKIEECAIDVYDIEELNQSSSEQNKKPDLVDLFIGYERVESIFNGIIVNMDQNMVWDFKEISPVVFPDAGRITTSALMFSGETGCGKHTADNLLMALVKDNISHMYPDDDLEDVINVLRMELSGFLSGSKENRCEQMCSVLNFLYEQAISEPKCVLYISLGDVTEILSKKKTALCLSKMISKFQNNEKTRCIITCFYEGKSCEIKDIYKKPFYVCEFDLPDKRMREEYLLSFTEKYKNIIFDIKIDKLIELTEDFTFLMLDRLSAYMLMDVKCQLIGETDVSISNYLESASPIESEKKITVDSADIERFVKNIRKTKFTEQIPISALSVPNSVVTYQSTQEVKSNRNIDNEENDDEQDESNLTKKKKQNRKIRKNLESCDTFEERDKIKQSLYIPTNYSDPDYEKKKAEHDKKKKEESEMSENIENTDEDTLLT